MTLDTFLSPPLRVNLIKNDSVLAENVFTISLYFLLRKRPRGGYIYIHLSDQKVETVMRLS